uniref:Uncharacterized protein n=1 Tax=Oreochromis niloticus TaxID=8128 RepID=A0A669F6Z0_ORENI
MPAGGSLVAATNYYQRGISSTSSSSSCGEAQHKAGVSGVTMTKLLRFHKNAPLWPKSSSFV